MKRFVSIFIFLIICVQGYSQQLVTWEQLSTVEWYTKFVKSLGDYYDLPHFSFEIQELQGKEIQISGFYIPIATEGNVFALSSQPSSMCFFCGGAGPESVIEVSVKKEDNKLKHIRIDKFIKMKGILNLNKIDPDHLIYILKDAELMEVIK